MNNRTTYLLMGLAIVLTVECTSLITTKKSSVEHIKNKFNIEFVDVFAKNYKLSKEYTVIKELGNYILCTKNEVDLSLFDKRLGTNIEFRKYKDKIDITNIKIEEDIITWKEKDKTYSIWVKNPKRVIELL